MSTGRLGAGDTAIQPTIFDAKGDLLTATAGDTPARLAVGNNGETLVADNSTSTGLKWAKSPNFVGCGVYKALAQSIPNATWTVSTFSDEFFDTNGFHSTTTNTSRITIPTGLNGKYRISGSVVFGSNATNIRSIALYLNGSSFKEIWLNRASAAFTTIQTWNTIAEIVAGDYLEVYVYQDSGGALDINAGTAATNFFVEYLGA
jgi:hypothetical protein